VQSDLNFDQQKSTSITNKAPAGSGGTPLPEQQSTESETFTGPAGGGPNGVLGVTQGAPGTAGAANATNYEKTTNQVNNAIDKVQTEIDQAPGKINRLSVAVLLDSAAVKPNEVANWTKQIQAAVGFDKARGDVVQVTSVAFSKAAQKAAKDKLSAGGSGSSQGQMLDLVRTIVTLAIIALVLFFAWRAIKKAEANRVPLRVPLDLRELEAADTRALESPGATPRLSEMERRALQPAADGIEGELTDLIEHQPDEVAQTLRSWLADRRT
jgi:flagellar M-ring protein FliF